MTTRVLDDTTDAFPRNAATAHAAEVARGERFKFGENWRKFLESMSEERVQAAMVSLQKMLDRETLAGLRFLDIGSGSGLFSLAAHRLGARVTSFDYDSDSVGCTNELRRRYAADSENWAIRQGSVLDDDFMRSLGQFDIVYSWGVLHHTGAMWKAIDAALERVAPGGWLFIAIFTTIRACGRAAGPRSSTSIAPDHSGGSSCVQRSSRITLCAVWRPTSYGSAIRGSATVNTAVHAACHRFATGSIGSADIRSKSRSLKRSFFPSADAGMSWSTW